MKFNQDHVLKSFYEERQNRSRNSKRHSLLQKNLSYFSTQVDNLQNSQMSANHARVSSQKTLQRKRKLDQYQSNLKQFTSKLQKYKTSKQPKTHESCDPIVLQSQIINKYQSPKNQYTSLDQTQEKQYRSPTFNTVSEAEYFSKYHNTNKKQDKGFPQHEKQNNGNQTQEQIQFLREKVIFLEKQNKKQTKFIDSVNKMRKTIEKTEQDCSLKQLWRWLKTLPDASYKIKNCNK